MEPVTVILGGITISIVSGAVGRALSNNNKVKEKTCIERRESCILLVSEKIENLVKVVGDLKDAVNKTVQ